MYLYIFKLFYLNVLFESIFLFCPFSFVKIEAPGSGAHLGRMTLDPAVTAFCLAASRPFETARDAHIKA